MPKSSAKIDFISYLTKKLSRNATTKWIKHGRTSLKIASVFRGSSYFYVRCQHGRTIDEFCRSSVAIGGSSKPSKILLSLLRSSWSLLSSALSVTFATGNATKFSQCSNPRPDSLQSLGDRKYQRSEIPISMEAASGGSDTMCSGFFLFFFSFPSFSFSFWL